MGTFAVAERTIASGGQYIARRAREVRDEYSSISASKGKRSRSLTPRVYRDWSGGGDRTGCGILSTARFRDWQGCVCSQCLFENRAGGEDHGHGGPVRNRSGRAHSAANDSCGGVGSRLEAD